jgi:hypothetical protein
MEIRFTLTEQDVLKATRSVSQPRWATFIFVLLLGLLFLVGIFLVDHGFSLIGWLWLGLSVGLGFAMYERPRLETRKRIRESGLTDGEMSVMLSPDGTKTEFPPAWKADLAWDAYSRFVENQDAFLLHYRGGGYTLIPKRVLSTEQMAELRNLLHSHLAK